MISYTVQEISSPVSTSHALMHSREVFHQLNYTLPAMATSLVLGAWEMPIALCQSWSTAYLSQSFLSTVTDRLHHTVMRRRLKKKLAKKTVTP